jgi:hypothetical protein
MPGFFIRLDRGSGALEAQPLQPPVSEARDALDERPLAVLPVK